MDYNARYYSPVLGRFISLDSIVPEPTSSSGFNRYRYTRNNPIRYTDPSELFECAEAIGCAPTDSQRYRNTFPSLQEQAQIQENINTVLKSTIIIGLTLGGGGFIADGAETIASVGSGQWGNAAVSVATTATPFVPGSAVRRLPSVYTIASSIDNV